MSHVRLKPFGWKQDTLPLSDWITHVAFIYANLILIKQRVQDILSNVEINKPFRSVRYMFLDLLGTCF